MLNLRDFIYLNLLKPECSQVPPDVAINIQDGQGDPVGNMINILLICVSRIFFFFAGGGGLAKFLIPIPLLRTETCRKI